MFANYTLFDYVPPDAVRELAVQKPEHTEIHERSISTKSRRTHVMTPRYSLASQCMPQVGGHSPPAYVLLVREAAGPRRSVAIVPDESFSHQPCATFQSRQTGSRIVGRLRYEVPEGERAKFVEGSHYVCEPRALLGRREQIEAVRIGNVDWGGARVRLEPGQPVAVSYGDLFVGLVATPLAPNGTPASGSMVLEYGESNELRLCVRLFGGDTIAPDDEPLRALLMMDVRPVAEPHSLEDYAAWLGRWQLALGAEDGYSATHPDEPTLGYPYTERDPDPIGDALHRSPEMSLRPGDLVRLVSGELRMPFADPDR